MDIWFVENMIFQCGVGYCFIHAEAMRRPEPGVRQYVPAPYFYIIKAELGYGEAKEKSIMKKLFYFVGVALLAVSCTTITKTAKTVDAPATLLSATVADLEIMPERVSYSYKPEASIIRGGMENVKQDAISQLLNQDNFNGDVLVDANFSIKSTRFLVFNFINEVTVSGHPAKYKNFHSLNDSVWCNPAFRYYYKDSSKRGGGLLNNLFGK